jgi:hypothetical protein
MARENISVFLTNCSNENELSSSTVQYHQTFFDNNLQLQDFVTLSEFMNFITVVMAPTELISTHCVVSK